MKTVSRLLCSGAFLTSAFAGLTAPAHAESEQFIGEIQWWGGNFCPRGWAPAEGQILSISENSALFSLFGTTYGGDGRTTFGLPDLRGRAPAHYGDGPGLASLRIGEKFGSNSSSFAAPSHSHSATTTVTLRGANAIANNAAPEGNVLADGRTRRAYAAGPADTDMGASLDGGDVTVSSAGGGVPVDVSQPSLVLKACVAFVGIFPSRS